MAHRSLAIIRRRLFTIVSVLSLLLWLATLALWVRSYWRAEIVHYVHQRDDTRRWFELQSLRGSFAITFERGAHIDPLVTPVPRLFYTSHRPEDVLDWRKVFEVYAKQANVSYAWFLGFGFVVDESTPNRWVLLISFPHWSIVLLTVVLPTWFLIARMRSRKRRRGGLCPKCGYDLRATPDRCPECGTNATAESQRR